ncbi:hypothetical protein [Bacteroidetes bacterium endosymbiont of Geopemphigus sp.]|uniref:hypothetical protein n=1 Tax=Bacteroidetes bacterium endosymbiont of Geopemphigus sp. TaxID=2047937 RepID=UPI000CD2FEB4|nr:hypothetical protein [Bacteroidetes bacterium endosymbiont of Geopemphigus sp.]
MKSLIDKGSDINAHNNQGKSQLHLAAQIEAALALIAKGADSTIRDNSEKTASEKGLFTWSNKNFRVN